MNTSWLDAARQYRNPPPPKAEANPVIAPKKEERPPVARAPEISSAMQELTTFLRSEEGAAALELLAASKQIIRFGEERASMGYGQVYYMDQTGLHESYEPMGTWMAYSKDVPGPKISTISPEQLVVSVASCDFPCTTIPELIHYLRKELDAIASRAPKSAHS